MKKGLATPDQYDRPGIDNWSYIFTDVVSLHMEIENNVKSVAIATIAAVHPQVHFTHMYQTIHTHRHLSIRH